MPVNNGQLLAAMAAQQPPQPVGLQVAQPVNDVQMLCLVAGTLFNGNAREAVADAVQIVAEAVTALRPDAAGENALSRAVKAILVRGAA